MYIYRYMYTYEYMSPDSGVQRGSVNSSERISPYDPTVGHP